MTQTAESAPANAAANAWIFAVLPPLFWAGNFLFARMFRDAIPPFQMSFWRWALALLILAPFAASQLRGAWAILRREWPLLAALGLFGVTAFNCFIYVALHHTTVVNAALINSLMPVMTFTFAFLLLGSRLNAQQLAGIVVSLAGAAVVITQGSLAGLVGLDFNAGDLLVVGGLTCWALYTVMIRWRPSALPPLAFLLVTIAFGTVFHLPLVAYELATVGGFAAGAGELGVIAYYAVFPSLLAYIFWNRAVKSLGPGRTAMFMHLMPIFSALLAVIFLGEVLRLYHFVGLVLIVGGITLVTKQPNPG